MGSGLFPFGVRPYPLWGQALSPRMLDRQSARGDLFQMARPDPILADPIFGQVPEKISSRWQCLTQTRRKKKRHIKLCVALNCLNLF